MQQLALISHIHNIFTHTSRTCTPQQEGVDGLISLAWRSDKINTILSGTYSSNLLKLNKKNKMYKLYHEPFLKWMLEVSTICLWTCLNMCCFSSSMPCTVTVAHCTEYRAIGAQW